MSQNAKKTTKKEPLKTNQVLEAEGYGSKFAKVAAEANNEERAADRKMSVRFTK